MRLQSAINTVYPAAHANVAHAEDNTLHKTENTSASKSKQRVCLLQTGPGQQTGREVLPSSGTGKLRSCIFQGRRRWPCGRVARVFLALWIYTLSDRIDPED